MTKYLLVNKSFGQSVVADEYDFVDKMYGLGFDPTNDVIALYLEPCEYPSQFQEYVKQIAEDKAKREEFEKIREEVRQYGTNSIFYDAQVNRAQKGVNKVVRDIMHARRRLQSVDSETTKVLLQEHLKALDIKLQEENKILQHAEGARIEFVKDYTEKVRLVSTKSLRYIKGRYMVIDKK